MPVFWRVGMIIFSCTIINRCYNFPSIFIDLSLFSGNFPRRDLNNFMIRFFLLFIPLFWDFTCWQYYKIVVNELFEEKSMDKIFSYKIMDSKVRNLPFVNHWTMLLLFYSISICCQLQIFNIFYTYQRDFMVVAYLAIRWKKSPYVFRVFRVYFCLIQLFSQNPYHLYFHLPTILFLICYIQRWFQVYRQFLIIQS